MKKTRGVIKANDRWNKMQIKLEKNQNMEIWMQNYKEQEMKWNSHEVINHSKSDVDLVTVQRFGRAKSPVFQIFALNTLCIIMGAAAPGMGEVDRPTLYPWPAKNGVGDVFLQLMF